MPNSALVANLLQGLASQALILIVAVVGIIVTLTRWKDAPSSGVWSLLGFGMTALLCFLIPLGQVGMSYWIMNRGLPASQVGVAFTIVSIFWSLLRAASYIFLLAAIFAGRPQTTAPLERRETL